MQQVALDSLASSNVVDSWSDTVEETFWADGGARTAFFAQFPNIRVRFAAPNSIDSAISESVTDNFGIIVAAVAVISVFVVAVVVVRGRIFVRTTLGLLGLLSVALSISAGLGLSLLIGIPFTTVTQVLPFILLGVGVDDLFLLVQSLEEVDATTPGLPLELRFRKTLNRGGMSITVTSLTNVAAFLFGSLTSIPAIRWCATLSASLLGRLRSVEFKPACWHPRKTQWTPGAGSAGPHLSQS